MVPLLLEERESPVGTQQTQDEETRENVRARCAVILGYLKSVGEEEDTSPKEKAEEPYYTWSLAYAMDRSFYELVIRPVSWGWGATVETHLTFEQAEETEEEEEEYGVLHDYVLDDLSVDYDSAEKFHKYLMSLRRQHERAKKSSR